MGNYAAFCKEGYLNIIKINNFNIVILLLYIAKKTSTSIISELSLLWQVGLRLYQLWISDIYANTYYYYLFKFFL